MLKLGISKKIIKLSTRVQCWRPMYSIQIPAIH